MSAPTILQPLFPSGSGLKGGDLGVLYWLKADGTLVLANDTTPLPVVIGGASSSTTAATLAQVYKTVAASGVPEAAGTGLVECVTFTAQKNRTTANTGIVWIGFVATNDTQLRSLSPGEQVTYIAPDGKKLDLASIYIDVATNGDGVLVETGN